MKFRCLLILPLFVASLQAVDLFNLTFTLNGDSSGYSVTDCLESASGTLVIPSTYNSLPVISIGNYAFHSCSSLTSITIPDSVTSIGDVAFNNCTDLTSITIGNSVTSIERSAFSGCSGLTSVTIPDSVISIGNEAFRACSDLTSITIGNSVTSIGSTAFHSCSSLTSITIGNSVTSIGDAAFQNCSGLSSITIPDSVTSIGDYAFSGCSSLTSITIPDSVTSIGNGIVDSTVVGFVPSVPFASRYSIYSYGQDWLSNTMYELIANKLQQDDSFLAGISEAVTFDSSAIDQAIAVEAQARADAVVLLQANIDAVAASMQSYVDSAVAQARADGVSAGIQSVTSNPQSYQLYNESSIMEMNVSNPTISMLNESEEAQVEFTLETSTDLEEWNIEERIQRTVQATGDKFFVRIKSGVPYVTPTVLVFNHPSYGEILTDQSGSVLYGLSFDSAGGDPNYSGSAWPLAPQITDPEPDAGVTAALTSGTFSNASGGPWLKINNRPVYTYASDSEPNQASGHGLGSVWFTIKPDGTLNQ